VARLQQAAASSSSPTGATAPLSREEEARREAELVHLYETLRQGAGEAVRLLTAGEVEAPEDVLTVAQVREEGGKGKGKGGLGGWRLVVVGPGRSRSCYLLLVLARCA
jgi:hypothetical protein